MGLEYCKTCFATGRGTKISCCKSLSFCPMKGFAIYGAIIINPGIQPAHERTGENPRLGIISELGALGILERFPGSNCQRSPQQKWTVNQEIS
jgi:hypothetical protein